MITLFMGNNGVTFNSPFYTSDNRDPHSAPEVIQQIKGEFKKDKDSHDVLLAYTKVHGGVVENEITQEPAK